MNDEIKEILDKLNYLVKNEMSWWENYTVFSPKDTKQLLDYITNLQEKVKPYETGYINGVHDERERNKAEITNLQHTEDLYNQLLKDYDELEEAYQELNDSITWWNNRFNAVQRDYEDYKSRIEKAVEYIKEAHEQDFMWLPIFEKELLDILNGRSDE